MRLHRLRLTAIGPFRDDTELDLARFGDSGLFLIEGPTGAGKSTILDAISFALYGKTAQASASIERLKSHHAPVGTEPVVELVFETQRGRYRIRRTAPYERPKKRGTGTLPVRMQVWLYRLTDPDDLDGGELISNNLGDAEDEITRAVGLSHGQFVQTVLLPQGEFANFLTAKTEAKRDLLQKLFGTELLQRTQAKLIEGRQHAEKQRRGAVETVRAAVNAFAGATGLSDVTVAELVEAAERGATEPLLAAVATEQRTLAEAAGAAGHELVAAERVRTAADSQWSGAAELEQRRQLRARLQAQQQELSAAAGDHQRAQAELAAAERALTVASAADGVTVATQALEAGRVAEIAARSALPAELQELDERRLRRAGSDRAKVLGRLDIELVREQALNEARSRQDRLQAEQSEQKALVEQGESALAELPTRRLELTERLADADRAAAQLPAVTAERDRALSRLRAARRAEVAARNAAQERLVAQELFDSAERAERRVTALRQLWRASIASELGLALKSGDPCSVCGSIDHPHPAQPSLDAVSQDQLEQAEEDSTSLRRQVEVRRAQLAELQAELVRLQLEADQLTPDKAALTLDEVSAALDLLASVADEAPGLQSEIRLLDENLQQLRDIVAQARLTAATRDQELTRLATIIEQDELAVAHARDGHPTVAARMSVIRAELAAIESAADASDATRALLATATAAGQVFAQALDQAEFGDESAWRAALRSTADRQRLRTQVQDYLDLVASTQARLAADDLTDPALDAASVDLAELARELDAARTAEKLAAERHGAATDRVVAADRLGRRIESALDASATVLARTAAAIRLGNLVAGLGENRLKMELTTYVLVRRFADVLAAANTQLHRISQGRYQLEHTDARTGSAKSGLNLRVLDLQTGRPRDPGTLSGGETFYVSLALALGLADVVRAESGGIELGTLFIDEGFGTLDADVLDEVIDVLDGLRDGGRAVGIVSHVSELKMRIADRIRVDRAADGTSKLLTTV